LTLRDITKDVGDRRRLQAMVTISIAIAMFANAAWFGEALVEREWVPAVIHAFVWVIAVFVASVL
jgi:hypothetical protein